MSTTALDILIRAKDQASGAIRQVGTQVDETGKRAEASGSKMSKFGSATSSAGEKVSGAIKGMAAAAGFVAIDEMANKSLEAFDELEVGEKRLAYGLKAIGEGKKNLDGLTSWAKSFSNQTGVAESDIVGMQSKLTAMGGTFLKSLGPNADGTIKKITSGMVNLGSATGKSASLLLRSLGPALMNDPETAASQLVRYGVLTEAQEAKIKKLTTAGKQHAASMMEINALYSKYNGVAAASETPMQKIQNGFNQIELSVGGLISKGLDWLITTGWPAMKSGIQTVITKAQPFFAMLKTASAGILPALKQSFSKLWPQVQQLWAQLKPVAKVLAVILGLVVIGLLKALPTLIKIQTAVIGVWLKLETILAGVVVGAFRGVISVIQNVINWGKNLVNWVQTGFSKIVSFISGMPGKIEHAAAGMFDGIKNAFKSAIDWVISGWNRLHFTLPSVNTHIPGVGHIGGGSIGVPQIPLLANGGVATRATLAVIGEAGPEAVVPLKQAGRFGLGGGGRTTLVLDRHRFVQSGDFDVRYRGF